MPPGAYAIVGLFAAVSLMGAAIATATVGPRRPWAMVAPALAAFGSLYLVGHRLALSIGPEVGVLGFRIALLFDVIVALVVAFVAASAQLGVLRLFQAKERGASRDGLA